MFNEIADGMRARMRELEERAKLDETDQVPDSEKLRQISPETGKFLALMAASSPEGNWVELGTSAGYSGMWLSLACQARDKKLTTIDLSEFKAELSAETFKMAGAEDQIEFVLGDGLEVTEKLDNISFYFLDTIKTVYEPCYELVVPKLVPGGFLIADNAVSHADELQGLFAKAEADPRVDSVILPVGKGVLLCRKV